MFDCGEVILSIVSCSGKVVFEIIFLSNVLENCYFWAILLSTC
jgi:hypothetical protein